MGLITMGNISKQKAERFADSIHDKENEYRDWMRASSMFQQCWLDGYKSGIKDYWFVLFFGFICGSGFAIVVIYWQDIQNSIK